MINWWVVAGTALVYGALARYGATASRGGTVAVGAAGATAAATLSTVLFLLRVISPWSGLAWGALLGFSFAAGPVLLVLDRRIHRVHLWLVGLTIVLNAVAGALLIVMR
jgi:hypothetical protein